MSACPFCFLFLGDACILPICSGSPFKHPLSNLSLCVYLSKKKKKLYMKLPWNYFLVHFNEDPCLLQVLVRSNIFIHPS